MTEQDDDHGSAQTVLKENLEGSDRCSSRISETQEHFEGVENVETLNERMRLRNNQKAQPYSDQISSLQQIKDPKDLHDITGDDEYVQQRSNLFCAHQKSHPTHSQAHIVETDQIQPKFDQDIEDGSKNDGNKVAAHNCAEQDQPQLQRSMDFRLHDQADQNYSNLQQILSRAANEDFPFPPNQHQPLLAPNSNFKVN